MPRRLAARTSSRPRRVRPNSAGLGSPDDDASSFAQVCTGASTRIPRAAHASRLAGIFVPLASIHVSRASAPAPSNASHVRTPPLRGTQPGKRYGEVAASAP